MNNKRAVVVRVAIGYVSTRETDVMERYTLELWGVCFGRTDEASQQQCALQAVR